MILDLFMAQKRPQEYCGKEILAQVRGPRRDRDDHDIFNTAIMLHRNIFHPLGPCLFPDQVYLPCRVPDEPLKSRYQPGDQCA